MNSNLGKPIFFQILIIEDDPLWFEAMKELLEDLGNENGITLEIEVATN